MAFACDECAKSWPDKDNQLEDPGYKEGICPECYEEPDDDDDSGRKSATQYHPRGSLTPPRNNDDSQ